MSRRPKPKKPTVVFCELRRPPDEIVNISSQNGAEGVVSRMLPKSHVSHVILNANVSENRFLDMKVSTENKMKKKNMDLHDHFMNTFIKRLERKQQRWMREDTYVSKNFQISAPLKAPNDQHQVEKVNLGSLSLPSPPRPPTQLLYKRAKYPYAGVSRLPTKTAVERPTATKETLPRIHTVPAGTKRSERPFREARSGYPGPVLPAPPTSQQRAESVSTIDTRATNGRSRKRLKTTTNYDKRFTELISWLSPIGPSSASRLHSRGLLRNFSSVQASY